MLKQIQKIYDESERNMSVIKYASVVSRVWGTRLTKNPDRLKQQAAMLLFLTRKLLDNIYAREWSLMFKFNRQVYT